MRDGHAVEQERRQRVGGADDRPQQRHVGDAAAHQAGERNREDVEARRVRELIVPRGDRREVERPAEHVLKAVRVEQRVADRHVRMEQHEQLQEQRRRGERQSRTSPCSGTARRAGARTPTASTSRHGTGPERRARHDIGEVGVRAEAAGDERGERGAEQERRADRGSGVTPSSATAAPSAADASADAGKRRRGGRTIPFGVSVSASSITPSARGSDGPGTNVDDARIESASPCCAGRAGIGTWTSS